jgi:hypothetical protein
VAPCSGQDEGEVTVDIWVITQDCCGEYVSAWRTKESADAEAARLNADHRATYGRDNYSVEADELNG